jgi:uncharacterized protein (DUF1778 family)
VFVSKSSTKRAVPASQPRDATINLRVSANVRDLIDTAATMSGTTRTEFVLESARRRAIDVMLDQRLFALEPGEWRAFNRALDNPPLPNPALKDLMARKPPWKE